MIALRALNNLIKKSRQEEALNKEDSEEDTAELEQLEAVLALLQSKADSPQSYSFSSVTEELLANMNRDRLGVAPSLAIRPGFSNLSSVSRFTTHSRPTRSLSRFSESNVPRNWPPPSERRSSEICRQGVQCVWGTSCADLQDIHDLCTQLIAQEKQEAAKWYAAILWRDHARQRVSVLTNERQNLASSCSSAKIHNVDSASRLTSKRGRNVPSYTQKPILGSPVDNRPVKSLRLSPVHSPPANPSPGLSTSHPQWS